MNKAKEFIKNISPFNNRTEMPVILYIIKVIIIFWVFKFGSELVGEVLAKQCILRAVRILLKASCSTII